MRSLLFLLTLVLSTSCASSSGSGGGTGTTGGFGAGTGATGGGTSCTNNCAPGQTLCDGSASIRYCAKGADLCYHWETPQFCPSGQVCAGSSCGPCTKSSQCSATQICTGYGACADADGRSYLVTLKSATIPTTDSSGSAWDGLGGAPDPFVSIGVNGTAVQATSTKSDTFSPAWNEAITVQLHVGDELDFWVYDEDVSVNDEIDGVKYTDWLALVKAGGQASGELYSGSDVKLSFSLTPK